MKDIDEGEVGELGNGKASIVAFGCLWLRFSRDANHISRFLDRLLCSLKFHVTLVDSIYQISVTTLKNFAGNPAAAIGDFYEFSGFGLS